MRNKAEKSILRLLLIRIPTSLFTLGFTILITRMLGPEMFGTYQYMNTNIQLLIMFLGLNGASGLVFFASKKEIDRTTINSLGIRLFLFGVPIVVVLLTLSQFVPSVAHLLIPEPQTGWFWPLFFVLSYSFQKATIFLESILKGLNDYKNYNRGTFFNSVLATIIYGVGFFVLASDPNDVSSFTFILLAQGAMTLVLGFLYIFRSPQIAQNEPKSVINKISLASYWKYIRSGYASQITRFLNKRFDVWLVESFRGLTSLGYYQLATSFNQFVLNAIQPANQMIMTHVQPDKLNITLYTRHVRVLSSLVLFGSILLILLFPVIIPLLFGVAFNPAVEAAQILGLTSYFVFLTNSLALYNYTHQRLRYNLYAQLAGLFIIVLLDFILIPKFGITGAAWASFASYGASTLYMIANVPKAMGLNPLRFLLPHRQDFLAYLKK